MKTRPGATPSSDFGLSAVGIAAAAHGVGSVGHSGWAAQRLGVVHQASGVRALWRIGRRHRLP
jgi:hypothetical protein